MSLLLAALLVFAPMGAGQEVVTLAIAEADNSGAASTRTDAHRLVHLLRYGAASFGIPTTFLLGGASEPSLAIGDFNHDGRPDLAVAEAETDAVWLLRGDGTGGFGPPTRLAIDARQRLVAVGDFDGDGLPDQAVADQFASGVTLLFGDGTGDFSAPPAAADRSSVPAVVLGDFDQDGAVDLAMVDGVEHYVTIVLGDAHGEVRSTTRLAVGAAPTALALGDFNGDGLVDLVLAYRDSDDVALLLGDGAGGFGEATHFAVGAEPAVVVVGDLNGDGMADLAVLHSHAGAVSILFGDGQGGLGAPTPVAVHGSHNSASFAAARASGEGSGYVGPTVAALTLNPATIAGGSGASALATVTLGTPAPAGGRVLTLASSNTALAAAVPSLRVPEGATSATFTVGTNARYRHYSGLSFTVTISATNPGNGSTQSATLAVTAQPLPADFTSGVAPGARFQWQGLICGRFPPIGGEAGILYNCSPATASTFGKCTFRQECSIGCRRVAPAGVVFHDFCATSGPNPVALSRNSIVSGDRVPATLLLEAPVGTRLTQGLPGAISNQGLPGAINNVNVNASVFPHDGGITFPTDATSVGFEVATSYVPSTTFVDVVGDWADEGSVVITNGRTGHAWLAMAPPEPPPALPIPTLGDFKITGFNPVTGGQSTFAQIDVSGITSSGGPTIMLSSSHPAIASLPSSFFMPASTVLGHQVSITTHPPAVATPVTLTATDGSHTFSAILTVLPAPPLPLLSAVSVNPTSVAGGNASTGTVTLSAAAPSGGAVVALSTPVPAVAILPASVTVAAGATSATFTIATTTVTQTFSANIFADLAGTGRQALLTVTPAATGSTLSTVSLNPPSVVGGNLSTGTVTLSAAAPSGGAEVLLSSNAVAAPVPRSVVVAAGQSSGNFTVSTTTVPASTAATISAVLVGVTRTAVLTISPGTAPPPTVALSSFSVSPASVSGGSPSTGTVGLSSAAPTGGAVVSLSSNLPGSASVPSSVTVAAGATSASFTVTTFNVAATTVQLAATLGNTILFAPLTVNSPASSVLNVVTVTPTSVVGGTSATGTVTLAAATPVTAVVNLSDNSNAVTVPASVTVAVGTTSAHFTITTTAVAASTSAIITAVYGPVTQTAALTVTPASSGTLPAPSLVSPSADARFSPGQAIAFDWSDVTGASSYTIEIDDTDTFTAPLTVSQRGTASQYTNSTLPTRRLWWRVRANDAAGNSGALSAVRRFEVK